MDFEQQQPDSTTTPLLEGEPAAVTDDLVSFAEDTNEAMAATVPVHQTPIEPIEDKPLVDLTEKVAPTPAPTSGCCSADDGCPVCHFIGYLGEVTPQPVYDILVWKDVYKTAVIFFTILPLLILYCYCNPIVVTAYLLLGLVTSTFTYRVYRYVVDSFQKSDVQNPFLGFSDMEVSSSRHFITEWIDVALPHFVRCFNKLKHYVLVFDMIDTAKFAVLLYVIAVVGGYFSLRLLVILAFVDAFTLPKVYSIYRVQINETFEKMHKFVKTGLKQAKEKVKSFKLSNLTAKAKQN